MDFKESPFMYVIALCVITFVIVQSLFFIIKAWKRGKEIGIKKETLKNTVTSSALFTIAPAISILATVIVLASALGIVLPWIRLSVIGNLAYETVAAETTLNELGGNLSTAITDKLQFSAVAWVMTIGSCFPLFLMPFLCKKVQSKIGKTVNKNENTSRLADIISAAAFIGIMAAFIARAINGKSTDGSNDAGFLSICTLVSSMIFMLVLDTVAKKFNLKKFEPFVMPLSMFGAMGMAMLLSAVVSPEIASFTWWG